MMHGQKNIKLCADVSKHGSRVTVTVIVTVTVTGCI